MAHAAVTDCVLANRQLGFVCDDCGFIAGAVACCLSSDARLSNSTLIRREHMGHIKIYHNPKCSNSRNALALLREHGHEPEIILYLDTPPTRQELQAIIQATGGSARAMMRSKEVVYGELGLDNPKLTEDALIDAMLAYPILMNRPIVVTPKGTRLCRPPELVLEILPTT